MVVGDVYHIEARVQDIDPRLVLFFDPMKERYTVFETVTKYRRECPVEGGYLYSSYDDLMHVTTLEDEQGGFRPLDQRLMDDLIRMDTQRNDRWFHELREQARKNREGFQRDRDNYNEDVLKHYFPLIRKELRYGL